MGTDLITLPGKIRGVMHVEWVGRGRLMGILQRTGSS